MPVWPAEPTPPVTAAAAQGAHLTNGSVVGPTIWGGSGVPAASLGSNGDTYLRSDTPGTSSQRQYIKSAGSWTATAV
jgi:hypothetical protein